MQMHESIKYYRELRGLSQDALAKLVGYNDRSSIAKIEAGQVDLSRSKIMAFAEALGVTPGHILGFEVENGEPQGQGITMDDFTYALQNEVKTLTEMDKQILLSMAKQLNDARKMKDEGTD